MVKTLNNVGVEETHLSITKATYVILTAHITFNSENLKAFSIRSGTRQGWPFLPLLFNIVLEVLARAIWQGKDIKCILGKRNKNWKREVKL